MTKLGIYMLLSCAALQGLCSYGAQTQFKTDFSGGIPPEVILIDGDQNTPATAMANIGFSVGVPWIGYYIEDEEEYVACSTSWYKPSGTSDDWMILPTLHVTEGARLRWRARCSDKKYFDGYAVYVSTQGADPESFNIDAPLFSIAEESNTWQSYEFSLEEYEGQDINIAFVNNSTNKAKLYIDDIKAGTDYPIVVTLQVAALVTDKAEGNDIKVRGTVLSELGTPSELGDITLTYQGESLRISCADLAPNQALPFEFSTPLHLDEKQNALIEVDCQTENGYTYSAKQKVWSTYRPLLIEEFTGTWCSWCVRGIVYMELLKEHYGDMFIPMCVHEYDIMEVTDYFGTVDYLKEEGIPNAIVNRKYEGDPSAVYSFCEQALTEDIQASFTSLSANCSEDVEGAPLEVSATVAFREAYKGAYSIAYVLTEDNICVHADGNYCQKNAYAGGAAGAMGGFENMPSIIISDDIAFRDVVRYVSEGGTHGVAGSLPGTPQAGEEYSHQYSITIPDFIFNPSELSLIAMIVDNRSGEVLNARLLPLSEILGEATGLLNPASDTHEVNSDVEVYTISGAYLGHFNSVSSFRNNPALSGGCYILRYGNGRAEKLICH